MKKLVIEKGNNAHILQLTLHNQIMIIGQVNKLLDKYDSVSWVNRDTEFHIKRK